jgi:hypothetical protein
MPSWGIVSLGWTPDTVSTSDVATYDNESMAVGSEPEDTGTSSDLREWCSPVVSQDGMMSCVPTSIVGGMELLRRKSGKKWDGVLSPMFLWWLSRNAEGTETRNFGVGVRRALLMACGKGVCLEPLHRNIASNMDIKPSKAALKDGTYRKLAYCKRVKRLVGMKHALLNGHPFVFGITLFSDFAYGNAADTGIVRIPQAPEYMLGGHMMLAVGHDDATQMFLVKNSWGTVWGGPMKGYCWIPYEYVLNGWRSGDQWVIVGGGYC